MPDAQEQAQHYQNLIAEYEGLSQQIQALLDANAGHTENLAEADMLKYRQLAKRRDELYDQIKSIEASWLDEN